MQSLPSILFITILLAGTIALQIFLSKRENKWLGLILPIISLIFSIFTILSMMVYANQSIAETIYQFVMAFLLSNIPTIILLAIYFACREKFKKNRELDKMNIQDLQ